MAEGSVLDTAEDLKKRSVLSLDWRVIDECLIATCRGPSDCRTCNEIIYIPIFNRLEDSECTGLVIDKRGIECSREKKSLDQVVRTIMRYKNRSPLRKMALVTAIEYNQDELLLQRALFDKGVNVRLFSDLEVAISWAQSYP